ncbi:MAG: hypothetical protein JWO44_991 [Bacteroidetes bacterium]|nr:hypothetical protein [Bacteroidota bacterium]
MTIEKAKYILSFYDYLFPVEYKNELSRFHDVNNYSSFTIGETNDDYLQKARLHYQLTKLDMEKYSHEKYDDCLIKMAEIILEKNKEIIKFNLCPICGALARTPLAKQAPCGHRW